MAFILNSEMAKGENGDKQKLFALFSSALDKQCVEMIEVRQMVRILVMCFLVWTGLIFPAFAGEISDVRVAEKEAGEVEVTIVGDYDSYRAFTLQDPFKFVVDLEGAELREDLPRSIDTKSPIVSKVRLGQRGKVSRVVLESAKGDQLFPTNISEKEGNLIIRAWSREERKREVPVAEVSRPSEMPGEKPQALAEEDIRSLFGGIEEYEDVKPAAKDKEEERLSRYRGTPVTMDFYKTDIHNVFRLLAEIAEKNIIVDEKVTGELTLSLKEVPWDLAMEIIMDEKNLVKEEKLNTIIIRPKPERPEGKGELVVRQYPRGEFETERLRKKRKASRERAQEMIIKADRLENQGRGERAVSLYEEAFDLWNDNVDLAKKTAYMHYILGNFAKSYFFAGQAIKMNPKDSEALLYAALPAARMEKVQEASVLFDAAMKASPKIPEVYYNYGLFLEKHYEYDKALYIYQKYEKLFGPSLEISLSIARLYEAQEKNKQACERYREISFSGLPMDENTRAMVQGKIDTLCKQGEKSHEK